jgi:uncharacterized repeat protein (TIGR03943 family)
MNRVAQNFVLLLIGIAVVKIAADGTYLRYVKPALGPFLLVSGAILVLLALVSLARDLRRMYAATTGSGSGPGAAADHLAAEHVPSTGAGERAATEPTPDTAPEWPAAEHIPSVSPKRTAAEQVSRTGTELVAAGHVPPHPGSRAHPAPLDTDDEHRHSDRPHWLLLAPIAALLIVVPPALGAGSVQSGTTAQASIGKPAATDDGKFDFGPLPSGPAPTVRMYDLIDRASYDSSGELDRRDITVIGFIVRTAADGAPRTDGSHGGVDLARLVITCCVADAQTMRIHLAGDFPPPADDTWVSVRGRIQPDSAIPQTQMTPTLTVTDLHTVPTPARVYG